MKLAQNIKKQIIALGRSVDTITTKLLMLVLFTTIIPLFAIGDFSVRIIDQAPLGNKSQIVFYISLITIISISSLLVAIGIAALFARTITTPILKLVEAAKAISSGDLSHRVKIKGNNEISQLSYTFNLMADNLNREKQLKDNFIATLTHDLKVPMLAENQTIDYLINEAYGIINDEQKEVLQLIKSTNNSSLEMVSTLLDVYRYDSGNVQLVQNEFNLVILLKESIEQIKSLADNKKIGITFNSNRENLPICADEREIRRVLHNLISNAIYNGIHNGHIHCNIELIEGDNVIYTPKSGLFEYTTLEENIDISKSIVVSIKDDGIGIPREDMTYLFKRFSLSKGRKPAGTGLGLYYSYQVIERHSGYIWAESVENKGSVFKFALKLQHESE